MDVCEFTVFFSEDVGILSLLAMLTHSGHGLRVQLICGFTRVRTHMKEPGCFQVVATVDSTLQAPNHDLSAIA